MRSHVSALVLAAIAMAVLTACGTTPATTFTLDVTLDGAGAGAVTSDPVGIDTTDGKFEADFEDGTAVSLTAVPSSGSTFGGFGFPAGAGYDCEAGSDADTCVLTIDAAKSVVATFDLEGESSTLTVDVVEGGSASGSITSDPAGINTGAGTFSADFEVGTTVVLTAAASAGGFAGWTGGDCAGLTTTTCSVTMGATEPQVTANFNDVLSVTVAVAASGDDAEEFLADSLDNPGAFPEGYVWATSTDLELAFDPVQAPQSLALRFANVTVPADAVILDASLAFTAHDRQTDTTFPGTGTTGDVPLTIAAEAAADPAGFGNGVTSDITTRTRTTATADWTITGAWTDDTEYTSTDASAVVQEIIGLTGWASGNAMVFFLDGEAGVEEYRRAYSYDRDPTRAPTLTIEYVVLPTP